MSEIILYRDAEKQIQIEVKLDGETVWLSQEQISELFERDRTVITRHLRNVFKEGELDEQVVCANFAHTTKHGAIEGKTQEKRVKYYNLDAILSVGYRVNSKRGTQFRQWATARLKDYLEKNKHRFKKSGEVKINDNGLTALALLVAQSIPAEKELMIKLVINLING